jgi:hypothetical protein
MGVPSDSRDRLRALVDSLPDEVVPQAISLLSHLEDEEPLTAAELANIESGEDDIRHGRMTSMEEYERQRGL